MSPNADGRFCGECQKTVIDFTTWSDTALYQFFSKQKGSVCGRFLSTQTDRPIHIPHQPHSRLYRMTIALGLTLLFTQTPHLLAQNRPPVAVQQVAAGATEVDDTTRSARGGAIKGQVVDDEKEPMLSAAVQVYQNGVLKGGTITDYDGNYMVKPLASGVYEVIIIYAGYDSFVLKNIVVNALENTIANAKMRRDPRMTLGGSVTIQYRVPLVDIDNPTKRTFTRKELEHLR
ncbi:MAG: carboxypeptidase-like regulatory domain-containing protein [Bacteroidota bacterium]